MIIYINNIQYSYECDDGHGHVIISKPKIDKHLYGAGATLTFDILGYSPAFDAAPLLVEAFDTATGKPIFHGHLKTYETKYETYGPVTTLHFEDNGRHLHYRPIFGHFKLVFNLLIYSLLDRAKATNFLAPVVFKVGKYFNENVLGYESIENLLIDVNFDGQYLLEALNIACAFADSSWMIDSKTGQLKIFQILNPDNTIRTFNLGSFIQGCVDIRKIPEKLTYANGFPLVNKMTTFGTNGEIVDPTLLAFTKSKLTTHTADIPKGSVRLDYNIIPELATRIIQAKLYSFLTGCTVEFPAVTGTNSLSGDGITFRLPLTVNYTPDFFTATAYSTADSSGKVVYEITNVLDSSRVSFFVRGKKGSAQLAVTIKVNGDLVLSYNSPIDSTPAANNRFESFQNYLLSDYVGQSVTVEVEAALPAQSGTVVSNSPNKSDLCQISVLNIDLSCCYIDTIAGTGALSTGVFDGDGITGGDGSLATTVGITGPQIVRKQSDGSLIFIENTAKRSTRDDYVIRKIDPDGILSTLMGQQGERATNEYTQRPTFGTAAFGQLLGTPQALELDEDDNIYYADNKAGYIGKIDNSTGVVSLFFDLDAYYRGLGVTGSVDSSVTVECFSLFYKSDYIYLTHGLRHIAGRIDLATQTHEILAGIFGSSGNTGDGGLATSAKLFNPNGIGINGNNEIYIGQPGDRVRKIDADGNIDHDFGINSGIAIGAKSTIALMNSGYLTFFFDENNNVYFGEQSVSSLGGRVRFLDISTNLVYLHIGLPDQLAQLIDNLSPNFYGFNGSPGAMPLFASGFPARMVPNAYYRHADGSEYLGYGSAHKILKIFCSA